MKDEFIESIKSSIPVLQKERIRRYKEELSLPEYDANLLTEDKTFSDYFEYIIKDTVHYKAAANWMLGPVKTWLNDNNKDISSFPVLPERLAELINMVDAGELSFSVASGVVLQQMLSDNNKGPREIAVEKNLFQQSDANAIEPIIDAVLAKMADKVSAYKKGKKGLLSLFVGEVMKQSKGKADPKLVNKLLLEKLQSS